VENHLKKSFSLNQDFHWNFLEETGVGFIEGKESQVVYLSFSSGVRIHLFSYLKINQIILFIGAPEENRKYRQFYYRLIRKLRPREARLEILSLTRKETIQDKLDTLLEIKALDFRVEDYYQFFFHAEDEESRSLFIRICLEFQIPHLKNFSVFPARNQEKKKTSHFVEEENFIISGEMEEKTLPYFLQVLKEERIPLDSFRLSHRCKVMTD
jgi:hypothetical protein